MSFNSYNKQVWSDSPDLISSLSASNLNHAEQGIQDASDRIDLLYKDFRPEEYATNPAVCGNGVTDDTDAFTGLAAAITALGQSGSAVVTFRPGAVYRLGRQTLSHLSTGGSWVPTPLFIVNNIRSLFINGNGAVVKFNDGLRTGLFDYNTGLSYGSTTASPADLVAVLPYVASASAMFKISNVTRIVIRDLEIDGNDAAFIKGGCYGLPGAPGYDIDNYGIWLRNCYNCLIEGVNCHNVPEDGVFYEVIASTRNSSDASLAIVNSSFTYAGRNNVTIGGAANVHITASRFNQAGNGAFTTSPMVGIDFETNDPPVASNALVTACEFVNNKSRQYAARGWRNLLFKRCVFRGSTLGAGLSGTFATMASQGVHHEDCDIYGTLGNYLSSDPLDPDSALKPDNSTHFRRCRIEDADYIQPVVFLDQAGYPTLQAEAKQTYGASTAVTSVSFVVGPTTVGGVTTNASRFRATIYSDGVQVEDFNNLNTVGNALATLNSSKYVVFANCNSLSTNPTVDPAPISAVVLPVFRIDRSSGGLITGAGYNTLLEDCVIIAHSMLPFNMTGTDVTAPMVVRRSTIVSYYSGVADQQPQSTLRTTYLDDVKFVEPPTLVPPKTSWYINVDSSVKIGPGGVTVGPAIHWGAFNGPIGLILGSRDPWLGYALTVTPRGTFSALTGSRTYWARITRGSAQAVTRIGVQVGVSSGNISVAVYRNTGVGRNAVPGLRAATSGTVTCPASGYAEILVTPSVSVSEGDWLALSVDNSTATFLADPAAAPGLLDSLAVNGAGHPAPSTVPALSSSAGTLVLSALALNVVANDSPAGNRVSVPTDTRV